MNNIDPCTRCGSKDYYNEAGFFYCKECQLQREDVREFEFDEEPMTQRTNTMVIQKEKKKVEQVTSWECYNYVLLGLTNEVMDLGAEEKFKKVVQALWFKYLKYLEVIRDDPSLPPKLQAYNNKIDAEIVYKRKSLAKKRKRRTSTSSASSSSTMSKREQSKLKLSYMKAEYESNSNQQADGSLHNVSLSNLTNQSDDSKKQSFIQFEKNALAELTRIMTPHHLKKHIRDVNNELGCHKVSNEQCKMGYRLGPQVLNRSKLYVVIYLALVICEERIQLGDFLRFQAEGHVTINNFKHFFPEFLCDKSLNMINLTKNQHVNTHNFIRKQSAKVALFLEVEDLVKGPDLCDLAKRYQKELNLPDEICNYVIKLIKLTKPKMKVHKERYKFPNYEARVICLYIFTLKLFYGLDDTTEFELSKLTENKEKPSFDFKMWLHHILYRKLVLCRHHFPTQYSLTENIFSSDVYINHMKRHFDSLDLEPDNCIEYVVIKDMLDKAMQATNEEKPFSLNLEGTLTPFHDYLKELLTSGIVEENGYLVSLLNCDFKNDTLAYLDSDEFGEAIKGPAIEHIKYIEPFKFKNANSTDKGKVYNCDFVDDTPDFHIFTPERRKHKLRKGVKGNVLYKPEHAYWILSGAEFDNMTKDFFNKYFDAFPLSFRIVVEEGARVAGQTLKDIIEELNIVESYLCYVFDFRKEGVCEVVREDVVDARLASRYLKFW